MKNDVSYKRMVTVLVIKYDTNEIERRAIEMKFAKHGQVDFTYKIGTT